MQCVYVYSQDHRQFRYFVFDSDDCDFMFDHSRQLGRWRPISPKVIKPSLKLKRGDFWNFGIPPIIVSEHAREVLSPIVEDAVEWLPLSHEGENFYVMNVVAIANCVDMNSTKFAKNGTTRKVHFLPDRLKELTVFRVAEAPGEWATDRFKAAVESAGLQGLLFKSVWKG